MELIICVEAISVRLEVPEAPSAALEVLQASGERGRQLKEGRNP